MTAYQWGYAVGQCAFWIALGLAVFWFATGRWRN